MIDAEMIADNLSQLSNVFCGIRFSGGLQNENGYLLEE